MLTTARPVFEHVPASFADPVGLADQQAEGVVSLIVVRYDAASGENHGPLGPTYDAFVASSGQLLAVARTTPDYRFPVTPAAALSRFIEHRDAGHPAFLSLFELAEDECARFLETVFYAECLKLHVDGAASAGLVARQIARSGCSGGVLEVNDFSDPERPRVRLLDMVDLTPPGEPTDPDGLTPALLEPLEGVSGRVLLYDRAKNRATLPDRTDRAFDLDGMVEQANRLALARRGGPGAEPLAAAQRTANALRDTAADDQAEAVEGYLRERATRPRLVEPTHPHATGLGALVAELQGGRASATPSAQVAPSGGLALTVRDPSIELATDDPQAERDPTAASGDGTAGVEPPHLSEVLPHPNEVPPSQRADTRAIPSEHQRAHPPSPPPQAAPRHPLATELDRLRTEVFALFEDAVGRDRAVAHEAHVLDEAGIASPVAPADTVRYLRALLCDEPPKRWHFFKRSRAKTYETVAGKLLAFHAANGHLDDPAQRDLLHEVTRLWTRLHK